MRRYIRHRSAMPIDYRLDNGEGGLERLSNVCAGGACFVLRRALEPGRAVRLFIPVGEREFMADGEVVWCQGVNGHYEAGLRFRDATTADAVQMVEQLRHIEQYRQHVRRTEGRILSSEEAAGEWCDLYPGEAPRLDS